MVDGNCFRQWRIRMLEYPNAEGLVLWTFGDFRNASSEWNVRFAGRDRCRSDQAGMEVPELASLPIDPAFEHVRFSITEFGRKSCRPCHGA